MLGQGKLWMATTKNNSSGVLGKPYYDTVNDLSPIAYWRLGENTGTTASDEIGNSDGTYSGGTTLEQNSLLLGDNNKSVLFDGVNGKISGSDSVFPSGGSPRSITFLIKFLSINANKPILGYGTDSSGNRFDVSITSTGGLGVKINGAYIFYDTNLQVNTNYHVSITSPNNSTLNDVKIYIDKVLNNTVESSLNPTNSINTIKSSYSIGTNIVSSDYIHAILDEVAIFDKELTQEEVVKLYNATKYIKYTFRIDHTKIQQSLSNYPILINLESKSGINSYDTTNVFDFPDNSKIIVKFGNQYLYTEIDRWDITNKSAQLWSKVPNISDSSDTNIELICDLNATINIVDYTGFTGTSPAKNVWDINFMAVYHLTKEPTGGVSSYLDSTANGKNMTPINLDASNLVDADIGKAINFNGVDERFYISGLNNVPSTNTIEAVHNADERNQLTSNPMVFECRASSSVDEWMASLTCSSYPRYNYKDDYTTSGFYKYITGVNNGSGNADVFELGYKKASYTGQSTSTADSTAQISSRRTNSGSVASDGWLKGSVSEVRVSNIKRSDSYIFASSFCFKDTLLGVNTDFTNTYQSYMSSLSPSFYFKLNNNGDDSITSNSFDISKYGVLLHEKSLLTDSNTNSIFFKNGKGLTSTSDFETDSFANKTIVFLAKLKDLTSTQIIFKEGGGTNGWGIGIVNGVGFRIGTREGGTGNYGDLSTTGYNTNQIYHFVGIIDSANNKIQLYINNSLVINKSATIGSHNGSGDPSISNSYGGNDLAYSSPLTGSSISEAFHGYLSDIAIFNRVLTTTEINDLYMKI